MLPAQARNASLQSLVGLAGLRIACDIPFPAHADTLDVFHSLGNQLSSDTASHIGLLL